MRPCGFEVEGVLRGEFLLGGRYVDDVLMALDLTAAPASGPIGKRVRSAGPRPQRATAEARS